MDQLLPIQRLALQQAAVVGRVFWDAILVEFGSGSETQLAGLVDRDLIIKRQPSAFADTDEYAFKHTLLRDVAYETVLLKLRRVYHAQVAAWLERQAAARINEYLSLIARHYELAEKKEDAAEMKKKLEEAGATVEVK